MFSCLVPALLLGLSFGSLSAAAQDARRIPVGQRQLFLDDDVIAKGERLQRTLLHPPE